MAHEDDQTNTATNTIVTLLPAAILLVILAIFAFANSQKVTVDLIVTETEAPLVLILLVTAIVGALIASLVRFQRRHH